MRLSGTKTGGINTSRGLGNQLYDLAGSRPSLDLQFSNQKSLVDATTGANLVTFTRASSGTYVDSQGVIRTATTNLLLRSEEFNDANWTKQSSVSVSANTEVAPNGTLAADTITGDQSLGIFQNVTSVIGLSYVNSVYVKAGTATAIMFRDDTGAGRHIVFNPSTGAITATSGSLSSYGSQAIGGGWYRYWMVYAADATTVRGIVRPNSAGSAQTFVLWGAQLEQSSTVGEYIPTGATINSAPRFDHNPTTGESLGLLVEEQRTNEVRNSNSMSAVVTGSPGTLPTNWGAQGNANGWTREVVGSGSLGALNYVDIRFSGTPTSSNFAVSFQSQGVVAASNGQTWAASLYYQLVAGSRGDVVGYPAANLWSSTPAFLSSLALQGAVVPTATMQRYTGSATISQVNTAFISWGITFVCTIGNAYDFTIRFAGPQLELGSFVTSFVPTTGTAATRSADVASISGSNFSSWYRQDEGTVYVSAVIGGASNETGIAGLANAGETDFLRLSRLQTTSRPRSLVFDDSAAQADTQPTNTITVGQAFKLATVLKQNDFSIVLDGGAAAVDASGTMPTVDRMTIGTGAFLTQLNGRLSRLTYFPQRLSNNVLQELTR